MKNLLFTSALLISCASGFAQNKTTGLSYGVKAGATLSNLVAKEDGVSGSVSIGNKVGYTLGGFVKIPLGGGNFSLQPELAFANLGAKSTEEDPGFGSATVVINMNYLQLPILAQYGFAGSGFHIYAGPQAGFLLSGKSKETYTFNGQTMTDEEDIKEEVKSIDLSLVGGLGFQLPRIPIRIDLRTQLGLSNLNKETDAGSVRLNASALTIGYVF